MANENVRSLSFTPISGAVTARRFAELTTAGAIQNVSTANADSIGVVLEDSANGDTQAIAVTTLDGNKQDVEAGGAVAIGDKIASDDSGRAVTAAGATTRELGIALSAASAAGEIIEILGQKGSGVVGS